MIDVNPDGCREGGEKERKMARTHVIIVAAKSICSLLAADIKIGLRGIPDVGRNSALSARLGYTPRVIVGTREGKRGLQSPLLWPLWQFRSVCHRLSWSERALPRDNLVLWETRDRLDPLHDLALRQGLIRNEFRWVPANLGHTER